MTSPIAKSSVSCLKRPFSAIFQINLTIFLVTTNDKNKTKYLNANFVVFPEDELRCSLERASDFNKSTNFIQKPDVAKMMLTEIGKLSKGKPYLRQKFMKYNPTSTMFTRKTNNITILNLILENTSLY